MNAAIVLDSSYDRPYGDLARILHEIGQTEKAVEYSIMAVVTNPTKIEYLKDFMELVRMKSFTAFHPLLKQAVQAQKALVQAVSESDQNFYQGKIATAHYFFEYELVKTISLSERLTSNKRTTVEMKTEWF
jgi:butyryl-CoA dehydrogenase